MEDAKMNKEVVAAEYADSDQQVHQQAAKTQNGITLVPQPSDDPQDPLNWSKGRKLFTLFMVSFAGFAGMLQAVGNVSSIFQQGALYGKTPVEITYSVSAATAGLCAGPLFWAPAAQKLGRTGCIFWAMIATTVCTIWAAVCTSPGSYESFVISRLFGCLFGSAATCLGASFITDLFFLHQRGKCFSFYNVMILLGTLAGPTFSGFVVGNGASWTIEYWYNVGLELFVVLLVFFCMEETGFSRPGKAQYPKRSTTFLGRAMDAYLFRQPSVPVGRSAGDIGKLALMPFRIGLHPVGILGGLFIMVVFGWSVGVNNLLAVFLQSPVEAGGYGFSPNQNAYFTFSAWIGCVCGNLYGLFFADKLPLWICKRAGGIWRPEYRLHALWIPSLVGLSIGLGCFGAALQYHLHYMVAALGNFLLNFSSNVAVPVIVNYEVECFTKYPVEAATIMNFYRTIFGIAIPFFIDPWEAAVGTGWVFGMMAFFSIGAFMLVITLVLAGHTIRHKVKSSIMSTEEGAKIIGTGTTRLDVEAH
ncbi:hypothetical protein LTR96_006075 [Exophiala xenobiotica]|uniref:Major facilitator superfamily (MFS) profile domain-containing protein n=1 Tax=Vermiconidia calcicola TaxID=1690605 RepID=A0AAV9QKI6_9PEZI|nr:hypothetical protein LTR96_006075 [Exophiala xenobiotica]KAK5538374.1 hypothetical protein LTR23_006999 [Chaetothyriales sp. CCFEE 6169]KAK5545012.1 hypothetical protein LTR25_000019 [Vermiconidia calcicola]KAK5336561.1 hypothetical protein LTR98_006867 [Exophiala xenobiotica]KAK5444426.1 hypothetical protein LTR18_004130 [Exophiala xenobiotica]